MATTMYFRHSLASNSIVLSECFKCLPHLLTYSVAPEDPSTGHEPARLRFYIYLSPPYRLHDSNGMPANQEPLVTQSVCQDRIMVVQRYISYLVLLTRIHPGGQESRGEHVDATGFVATKNPSSGNALLLVAGEPAHV